MLLYLSSINVVKKHIQEILLKPESPIGKNIPAFPGKFDKNQKISGFMGGFGLKFRKSKLLKLHFFPFYVRKLGFLENNFRKSKSF